MKNLFLGLLVFSFCVTQADLLHTFDQELLASGLVNRSITLKKNISTKIKKAKTLFLVYMAADNDLRSFAIRNLKQMLSVGSNQNIHIVVHVDIRDVQNKKLTRRYYIDKESYIPLNEDDVSTHCMDSGDPETLISFCTMATQLFPADEVVLLFWDHGTGYLDPSRNRRVNASNLFKFNPISCKLEIDRSIGYLAYLQEMSEDDRGVCWDQTTKNYLSNAKLKYALHHICKNCLGGKRFNLIAFDACLMAMVEVASLIEPYADVMVSSQEAILGTGFDYINTLKPFAYQPLNTHTFANHIVDVFESTYTRVTQDFALSAVDLSGTNKIIQNLNAIAKDLITCLEHQRNKSVKRALQAARNLSTHFNEPSYRDLHHVYKNIFAHIKNFNIQSVQATKGIKQRLEKALKEGCKLIEKYVFANTVGKKLHNARGLSIYFPERVHISYPQSAFAQSTEWFNFIKKYLETA